jgi:hypothetical protein
MDRIFDKERLQKWTRFLYQISCPFLQTFFIKYLVHFYKRSLSDILSIFTNVLYQISFKFYKRSLSNILSIFTNVLYQICCPFLQMFFIKYVVHFYKRFLTNMLSIFTNVLYQICCPFLQTFFNKVRL